MLSDMRANLIAVLTGHVDVGQNNVRLYFIERFDCSIPVIDLNDLVIGIGKRLSYETPDRWAIVCQKNCSSHNAPNC
jgi:hypothetical protein